MRVKRYVVDTMPDAMHSIRSDLGSDAVILSTKEIKIGGFLGFFKKKKIEVVAAVEKEQKRTVPEKTTPSLNVPRSAVPQAYMKASGASQATSVKQKTENRTYAELAAALSDAVGVLQDSTELEKDSIDINMDPIVLKKEMDTSTSALYESMGVRQTTAVSSAQDNEVLVEIREMKQWMERFARQTTASKDMPDPLNDLRERLIEQELDIDLIELWVNTTFDQWTNEGRNWTSSEFQESLKEQVTQFLSKRIGKGIARDTRILYIAGPTGVGKTTTIAKLAAEQLFRQGRKVGLITSDTYRISAVEQLRTYAAILNVPLEVVQSPGDMQRALSRLESCDLILMDTAGRNYRNEMLVAELQSLLSKELKSETYLVLSLTSKSRDMKIITEHFNKYQLDKVIFTKLDETESFGPLFNLLKDFPLGLSYLSNGQNVPDDLLMASEEKLYGMLLGTGGK
ncbi:flagellar biosynthesis protein FlhF [Paenibacillus wynnii]|uniref:Flagellar biosynthesis protein FlhF n=1 Tax=Paenibacillus wynnii TaxID=268407 RepID=A0A098M4M8_9BACL|nr:flagellar biosynthesis protein FlhF [Paenibacillus wynnii]KGE17510.1 flagellar GTP-binding protein [Paenibacillus wynnii]